MASTKSRSALLPTKGCSSARTQEDMPNGDVELQVRVPQKQKQGRQQSYENVNDQDFSEDLTHEYEVVDIHSRNKRKCPPGPGTSTGNDRNRNSVKRAEQIDCTDGNRPHALPMIFKILTYGGCLLSIASLILIILLMAGAVPVRNCGDCNVQLVSGQDNSRASQWGEDNFWKVIGELKSNVSHLNKALKTRDEKIFSLQSQDSKNARKIAELERKFTYRVNVFNGTTVNISDSSSSHAGVIGDTGLNNGKIGSGNMTRCRYLSKEGVPFTVDKAAVGNVDVTEKQGYKIVGVTCSTIGASEYNLKSELNADSLRRYVCECRGKSSLFEPKNNGPAKCIIHYWMCEPYY